MRTVALLSMCLFASNVAAQQAAPKPAPAPHPAEKVRELPTLEPLFVFPHADGWPEPALFDLSWPGVGLHDLDFGVVGPFDWPAPSLALPDIEPFEWSVPHFEFPVLPQLAFDLPDETLEGLVWPVPGTGRGAAYTPLGVWGDLAPVPAGRDSWRPTGELKYLPEPSRVRRQDTAEDSLYRQARETLNRGEYRRAADLFRTFEQRYAQSKYVPAAMYWQAFALYRIGANQELRTTLSLLERLRSQYPQAAQETDVAALYTRVAGALAARGDPELAAQLRASGAAQQAACDKEEMSVKAEALSALYQADRSAALQVIRSTLARRDECSVTLRRRAVYLLGREDSQAITSELAGIARNDPDQSVRSDAISQLGRRDPEQASRVLQELFSAAQDDRTQRSILNAMARLESESGKQFIRRQIEREDLSEAVRADAIRTLFGRAIASYVEVVAAERAARAVSVSGRADAVTVAVAPSARISTTGRLEESDAAYLRQLYGRSTSRTIKTAVLETLARAGGQANDAWLMGIIRNGNEEMRYRSSAMARLRRSDVPVSEVVSLYDSVNERELRSSIISVLRSRDEDAATDKLIDIARNGTDPTLRRSAISALTSKKDPRTTQLLLELLRP